MEDRRKLSAILFADVQGYGRLMGEDEAETVRVLGGHLQAVRRVVGAHRGRVVDCAGDSFRDDEMRAEAAEVVRLLPGFSVRRWMEDNLHRDPAEQERQRTLLRKAGLPE